jgi:Replication-relaxation
MQQTDSLGRATFHHIASRTDTRPTPRELRWLAHIARHGPQSSLTLLDLTSDTHRCRDTALRQLQRLRAGGYLCLPPQQRLVARAEFNPYVYDLTVRGQDCLRDHGLPIPSKPVSGPWAHQFLTANITSAIEIAALRHGATYIPQHEILARRNAPLGIPIGRNVLIPDQLFALHFGQGFRAFALEVDRGTEPLTSSASRKSLSSAIDLTAQMLRQRLPEAHYGLKANLLSLWVFTSPSRVDRFLGLLAEIAPDQAASFLATALPVPRPFGTPLMSMATGPWQRAAHPAFSLFAA